MTEPWITTDEPCPSGHTDCTVDCGSCKGTGKRVVGRRTPTPDEIEARLRENAAAEGRPLDAADSFLINMSRILGVKTTDRFIGEGTS